MRFYCKEEKKWAEVSMKDIKHLTGKTGIEIFKMGLDIGYNNVGVIGDYEYKIVSDELADQLNLIQHVVKDAELK